MSWYPYAIHRPGPAWKVNATPLEPRGVVCHSAVGFVGGLHQGLDDLYRAASWHFSILYDGTVEQHYDTNQQCWHAQAANAFAVGIEHEGGYNPENEPLTQAQEVASVNLVRWLANEHGFALRREQPYRTLFEHNEFYPKPCPSWRIDWGLYPVPDPVPTPRKLNIASPDDADLKAVIAAMVNQDNPASGLAVTPLEFDANGNGVYRLVVKVP